ncbi:hypothetical protein GWI33_008397 [Rhynchophorus ferrugineus]|uniref:Uncharacterized protein n=1 Tax=Rhynchophorus ferrugineus TaxID=354439 RepID=A0A834IGB3_RHYFE|nr:hypothetical protein GWI33_008397 [Rhynchophorus ferrugineus]
MSKQLPLDVTAQFGGRLSTRKNRPTTKKERHEEKKPPPGASIFDFTTPVPAPCAQCRTSSYQFERSRRSDR